VKRSPLLADDNPYPVIDNDFLNDTLENLIRSDVYRHIDFLTGVTLNEGLYFAEYHIGHFYSDMSNQTTSIGRKPPASRNKRSLHSNVTTVIAPDIVLPFDRNVDDELDFSGEERIEHKHQVDPPLSYDPQVVLEQFSKLNYIDRYISANFRQGKCFLNQVKDFYERPGKNNRSIGIAPDRRRTLLGKDNMIVRLKLYIDLVSDLMFNFHMVHCLNLRSKLENLNASNYVYIYSHRPSFKARSLLRDYLKTLPHVIGHFAELGNSRNDDSSHRYRSSRLCLWRTAGSWFPSYSHQCKHELLQLFARRRSV
jgi:hypothetical protein